MSPELSSTATFATAITRAASLQTYSTIRLMADRGRSEDAFRAYAYFRWVDDRLDGEGMHATERQSFVARQADLIERCYAGNPPQKVSAEEAMAVDLITNNPDASGPLAAYIRNLMAVMSFDAARRGRLITQAELNSYQHCLAVAVTEALHYFIGRAEVLPVTPERYLAVTGAHVTHMLRDTYDDIQAGYFNIPSEYVQAHGISPLALESPAYRAWVRGRVELARRYFRAGRRYLERVQCTRCRLAEYAYIARFETVLELIESDDFALRPEYNARRSLAAMLGMAVSILASSLGFGDVTPAHRHAQRDRAAKAS